MADAEKDSSACTELDPTRTAFSSNLYAMRNRHSRQHGLGVRWVLRLGNGADPLAVAHLMS